MELIWSLYGETIINLRKWTWAISIEVRGVFTNSSQYKKVLLLDGNRAYDPRRSQSSCTEGGGKVRKGEGGYPSQTYSQGGYPSTLSRGTLPPPPWWTDKQSENILCTWAVTRIPLLLAMPLHQKGQRSLKLGNVMLLYPLASYLLTSYRANKEWNCK